MWMCDCLYGFICVFFSSRRRHTRCALVTGVQTCALPICGRGAIEVVPAHRGDVGRGLGQRAVGVEGEAGFGMNELRYLILFNEVEHPVVLGAMHLHEPRPWIVLF